MKLNSNPFLLKRPDHAAQKNNSSVQGFPNIVCTWRERRIKVCHFMQHAKSTPLIRRKTPYSLSNFASFPVLIRGKKGDLESEVYLESKVKQGSETTLFLRDYDSWRNRTRKV